MLVSGLKVLVFDVDGVLTDGRVMLGEGGEQVKQLCLRDLDALTHAKQEGFTIALVTGEESVLVERIGRRVNADLVIAGAKDKLQGLEQLSERLGVPLAQVCYVGDAARDALAFGKVGLSYAPADAAPAARARATRVLKTPGGQGVAEEVVELVLAARADALVAPVWEPELRCIIEDSIAAHELLLESSLPVLSRIVGVLTRALRSGSKILLCGNGGSAAAAQHVAGEIVGRLVLESEPWPAIALSTDTSILTAVANDWDYCEVFARQVRALGRPGDVVVGITTSGRCSNVLRALDVGRALGATALGFTGQRPGLLEAHADLCFCAPAESTARIQELHLLAWHGICELVERALC